MRIQSAGVGQQPNFSAAQQLRLLSDLAVGLFECLAVRAKTQDCQIHGLENVNLFNKPCTAPDQFARRKFSGGGTGALDNIRQAQPMLWQTAILGRLKLMGCEPRHMKSSPKSVAGMGKVVTDGGGVQAGINPTEYDFQIGR